jgi:hypothetical protein
VLCRGDPCDRPGVGTDIGLSWGEYKIRPYYRSAVAYKDDSCDRPGVGTDIGLSWGEYKIRPYYRSAVAYKDDSCDRPGAGTDIDLSWGEYKIRPYYRSAVAYKDDSCDRPGAGTDIDLSWGEYKIRPYNFFDRFLSPWFCSASHLSNSSSPVHWGFSRSSSQWRGLVVMYSRMRFKESSSRMMCS